jgi:AcrR family transcriptional regulator
VEDHHGIKLHVVRWTGDGAMPQLIDTASRAGALAAAVNELLITEGIPGLTLRRIGSVSRVSPGSIIHHLGGKDRLLSLSAALTARALADQRRRRAGDQGVLALLPNDDEGVLDARAWLAWVELGRSDPVVEVPVTRARREERAAVAELLDFQLPRDDLDLLLVVVNGLRDAICAPARPLSRERARRLLVLYLRRLGFPVTPGAAAP